MATSAPLWSPPSAPPRGKTMVNGKVMVVAVAVLFAVVLFILCLHLYAKWFWRHQARTTLVIHHDGETIHHRRAGFVPDAAHTVGLERALVEALPTFEFSGGNKFECAVCLEDFEAGEKGRTLPLCGHAFHLDCIDMWLHSHSTCPLCRAGVIVADTKPELQPQEATILGAPFLAAMRASRAVSSLNSHSRTAEDRDEGENRGTETDATVTATETRLLPQNLKEYESRPAASGIRAPFQVTIDIPRPGDFGGNINIINNNNNNNNNNSSSSNPASVMSPMARASASFRRLLSRGKSVVTPPNDEGGPSSSPPSPPRAIV